MKTYIFSFSGTIEIDANNQLEAESKLTNEDLGKNVDVLECENED